jgi:hypothetical protein
MTAHTFLIALFLKMYSTALPLFKLNSKTKYIHTKTSYYQFIRKKLISNRLLMAMLLSKKVFLINDELVFAIRANQQISFLIYRKSDFGDCTF